VSDTHRPPVRTGGSIGILISGRGSNMQALIRAAGDGRLDTHIAVVISNRPHAPGLELARQAGIETLVVDHSQFTARRDFDRTLAMELKARNVVLVCLAGFMRLVGADLLEAFPQGVLNVHPSLLPAFPGLGAVQQAVDYGAQVFGVTVHLVDEGIDTGPIVLQRAISLPGATDAAAVLAQLRPLEHALLPDAVRLFARGAVRADPTNPRRTIIVR
jgi:phosphoribosylglycinamide formyltransferase 1